MTRKELLREASCRRPDTQAAATAKLHFRTPYDSTSELVLRQYSPRSKKIWIFVDTSATLASSILSSRQISIQTPGRVEKAADRERENHAFITRIHPFRLTVAEQSERERSEKPPASAGPPPPPASYYVLCSLLTIPASNNRFQLLPTTSCTNKCNLTEEPYSETT